jgi:ribosome-associated protein
MDSHRKINATLLTSELSFSASRSDGPGGQNVNKVSSKITLRWDVNNSVVLAEEEKRILLQKLSTRLTKDGILLLSGREHRSQLQNKDEVIGKLDKLLLKAFEKKKVRKATKRSKASQEKRIRGKKMQGEKKQWRQRP